MKKQSKKSGLKGKRTTEILKQEKTARKRPHDSGNFRTEVNGK